MLMVLRANVHPVLGYHRAWAIIVNHTFFRTLINAYHQSWEEFKNALCLHSSKLSSLSHFCFSQLLQKCNLVKHVIVNQTDKDADSCTCFDCDTAVGKLVGASTL